MKTIICLGNKACEIGEELEAYGGYIIKLIDKDIEGDNCYSLVRQASAEAYEQNVPAMTEFFSDISNDVLFITSSDCDVVSCSLKILEQIKNKDISIMYLRADRSFLSKAGILQDRVVCNVLQEYTRSGLFKKMFLVDETLTDLYIDEATVKDYRGAYLRFISHSILYSDIVSKKEAIIDNTSAINEASRICTFGFYNLLKDQEFLMYNINLIDTKNYHFFLTEATLSSDKKIMRSIKDKIKNKLANDMQVAYSIRDSSESEGDFCFVEYYSKAIQQ